MSFHSGSFDPHARGTRNRRVLTFLFSGSLVLGAALVYHSFAAQALALVAAAATAQGAPQPLHFDACTVFSAADAAQVLGVPVRPITNVGGCSYEAAKATSGGWRRNIAVNVSKYKSAAEESSAWGDLKILRHLEPGRRNLAVLSEIGSEAYMQVLPNRNAFEAELWVHKSTWHLRLISVTEQSPSSDALKAMAQRIAAKLP